MLRRLGLAAGAGLLLLVAGAAGHAAPAIGLTPALLNANAADLETQQQKKLTEAREINTELQRILHQFDAQCHQTDLDRPDYDQLRRHCAELRARAEQLTQRTDEDVGFIKSAQLALIVGNAISGQKDVAITRPLKRWLATVPMHEATCPRSSSLIPDCHELGVAGGELTVYDSFWKASKARRANLLFFELGKILWTRINGPDTSAPHTADAQTFLALAARSCGSFSLATLKSAEFGGEHLGGLGDSDDQSHLGYALRAVAMNLAPLQELERTDPKNAGAMKDYFARILDR